MHSDTERMQSKLWWASLSHQPHVHTSSLVNSGRGSVLLWRQSNMSCISGFMDDVKFLPARRYASAVLAVIVCPSVRLSHAGIVSERLNIRSPTTSENADFDRFRLIVPQPWELAKKVQLSLIGSWQCTSSHRWTLCVTPKSPKSGSKREFLYFALPFVSSLRVIADTSNLVCWLIIASPSLRTTNCPRHGRGHNWATWH